MRYYFLLALLLSGCTLMDTNSGLLYTDISYPLISTENEITEKSITVSNYSILGLFTFGNASLEKAKQEGNIKKISHVDVNDFIILGVYRKYSITVYGE